MQTLKELNSKWYWRLVKVIWALLLLLVLLISAIGFWELYKTYNPKYIAQVSNEITEYYGGYKKLSDSIGPLRSNYSLQELRKIGFLKNGKYEISAGTVLYILSKDREAKIERVIYLDNKDDGYYNGPCPTDSCTYYSTDLPNDFSSYMQSGSTLYVTSEDIDSFSSYTNSLISLHSSLEEFNNGNKSFEDLYLLRNNFFNKNEHFYQTYTGFIEWVKISLSTIGVFIILFIFTMIIRGILYYIIFGRFNPNEGSQ